MHTHPTDLPASVIIVHTSLPVPFPLQGVVHGPLSTTVASHAGGLALST
jgi:hypothetical protein